jgi:hypothetical protein
MPAVVLLQFPGDRKRMRRSLIRRCMDGSCFVRIPRAIVDMEIKPAAISRKLGGRFWACANCRTQMLDVVLGCSPQKIRHQLDEGLEPRGKAPADLLMNTENDAIVVRIDKPRPKNVADAAWQHKIVVPFASAQYRIREAFGECFPASDLNSALRPKKQASSTFPVLLFEIIRAAPATPAASVSALSASGHASREAAASWSAETRVDMRTSSS